MENASVPPADADPPNMAVRWSRLRPWVGTLARLTLGIVFLVAGGSKVSDLAASGRAVNAYHLMPIELGRFIGVTLPMFEIALGILLVVGLATRIMATIGGLLLVVFIAGIASAWARGLSIDCGCFGGDGQLGAGQGPRYTWEILRDSGLVVLAVFVVVYPRTRLSVDARLAGPEENE